MSSALHQKMSELDCVTCAEMLFVFLPLLFPSVFSINPLKKSLILLSFNSSV